MHICTPQPALQAERDYSVIWRGTKVGRISYDHKLYAGEEHARWRWFLNDTQRNRMANGRCATREEAIGLPQRILDTVPTTRSTSPRERAFVR